jgi:hypothetical protein
MEVWLADEFHASRNDVRLTFTSGTSATARGNALRLRQFANTMRAHRFGTYRSLASA